MSAPISDLEKLHGLIRQGGGPETTATALEIIKRIQEKGESVDGLSKSYKDSYSPLMRAAVHGRVEIADALIKAGADMNKFFGTRNPLFGAVVNNKVQMVELLLASGADKEAKMEDGTTPLSYAAEEGNLQIVKKLIEAGADVNAKANDGTTPLLVAAQFDNKEVVKALLTAGAKVMEPTYLGKSVFNWANQEDEKDEDAEDEDAEDEDEEDDGYEVYGDMFSPNMKRIILEHAKKKGRQELRNKALNRRKHAVNAFLKIRGNVGGGRRTRHRRRGRRSTRKA